MKKRDPISTLNPELTPDIAQGIRAWQAGQRRAAGRLFVRAVRDNPHNATAWYWLSRAVEDERQRQDCLARVRQLDQARNPPTAQSPHGRPGMPRFTFRARRRAWITLIVLVVVLTCAAMPLIRRQSAQAVGAPFGARSLQASGIVRAREVALASEYGGRIDAVPVRKGQPVRAGEVLVRLDTFLLDAQIRVAEAAVALAEAGLAQGRAGARPGQIAVAEAQLAQAETACLVARRAVTDTRMLAQNPQDIQLQIAVYQAQGQAAGHRLAQALALKDAAQIGKDKFQEAQKAISDLGGPGLTRLRVQVAQGSLDDVIGQIPPDLRDRLPPVLSDGLYGLGDLELEVHNGTSTLYRWVTVDLNVPFEAHLAPNMWWQAWVGVNAAAAEKEGIAATLDLLYAQRADPQAMLAQADQAAAVLAQAEAQVAAAQAQVAGTKAGATLEQLAALEARVQQARAALASLQTQRAQMTLVAPADGVVVTLMAHPGEIAARGATLIAIADLKHVRLIVYLPETQIGQVRLNETVQVSVDSFPGRTFAGTVVHIADTAEFTPRNVATQEERINLVFAVEIELPNEEGSLKPGMPADATFGQ